MDWFTVISLVVIGLALILIEFIFIPGTTVIGFLGFGVSAIGIYFGYDYFGMKTGSIILGTSTVITGVGIWLSIKFKFWKLFSLKEEITGKVNPRASEDLLPGATGISTSALRPSGQAEFNNKLYEVTSHGEFIDPKTNLLIVKISNNKIFVEAITES